MHTNGHVSVTNGLAGWRPRELEGATGRVPHLRKGSGKVQGRFREGSGKGYESSLEGATGRVPHLRGGGPIGRPLLPQSDEAGWRRWRAMRHGAAQHGLCEPHGLATVRSGATRAHGLVVDRGELERGVRGVLVLHRRSSEEEHELQRSARRPM